MAVVHPWPVRHRNGYPSHRAAWWYTSAVGFGVNRRRQLQLFGDKLPQLVAEHVRLRWTPSLPPDGLQTSGLAVIDSVPLKELMVDSPPVAQPEGSVQPYPVAYLVVTAMTTWSWDEANRQAALKNLLCSQLDRFVTSTFYQGSKTQGTRSTSRPTGRSQ